MVHGSAEEEGAAGRAEAAGEGLERVDAGGVDGSHVAEAQDDDGLELVEVGGGFEKLFGGAEEEGAVDAEERDVGRDDLALEVVGEAVADVGVVDGDDGGGFCHAADVKQGGEAKADGDSDGEVGKDGECEGDEPDGDGGGVEAEDAADFVPLAHVPGDDEEDGGESGEGDVAGQGRSDDEDGEEGDGVDHAGEGGACAGADVGGGAGDGSGGGDAAEEGRDDVGDALGNEFDVGVVAVAGHAVCDNGREHGLQRGEHGDSEGGGDEGDDVFAVEGGKGEVRKALGDAAEFGADGFYGELEGGGDGGRDEEGDDGGGDALGDAGQDEEDGEGSGAEGERGGVDAGGAGDEELDAGEEFRGDSGGAEAEEVLDLGAGDEDGDAVGEADDDHAGDEFDGGAEAGESHGDEDCAGHEGDEGEAVHAEAGDDAGDDDDECAGGAADLGAGAAEGGDEESGDDGGVEAGLGSDSAGDAEGHGEGQRDEADGEASDEVVHEIGGLVVAEGQERLGQVGIELGHNLPIRLRLFGREDDRRFRRDGFAEAKSGVAGAVEVGFQAEGLVAGAVVDGLGGEVVVGDVEFEEGEAGGLDGGFGEREEAAAEAEAAEGGEEFDGPEIGEGGGVRGCHFGDEGDGGKAYDGAGGEGDPGGEAGVEAEGAEELAGEAVGWLEAGGLNGVELGEVCGLEGAAGELGWKGHGFVEEVAENRTPGLFGEGRAGGLRKPG